MKNHSCPIDVSEITEIQHRMVALWHRQEIENTFEGFAQLVCQQHSFNFQLWHEEDIARSRDVSDTEIARVKRSIDKFNQQRNDWIEKMDDELSRMLEQAEIQPADEAPLNTETPGSVIDRLSIHSLRLYHLREQLERNDVAETHIQSVENKIAVCLLQSDDLSNSLQQLLSDIFSGQKRHRTYRQFKMYNDPSLNPYLYEARKRASA